jgi:hypothetical protein
MSTVSYTPPPSIVPFLTGDKFTEFIIGPVGSTKTTAAIMKLAYHAKKMKRQKDGIRRSRAVWVRNTREQLKDTSVPSFLTWYPNGVAGDFAKSDMKFVLKFDDVECEVIFRGLDDADDIRRLLSLELSFAVLDEVREINPDVYEALTARLGRYPSMKDGGCVTDDGSRNDRIWGATNPPDMESYWEALFTNPPENVGVTFQPSALSEEADWLQYLPAGYYDNIVKGKTEDWIDVYVHNKFGRSLAGKPVFRCFNRDVHVAKETVKFSLALPIIVGVDAGLNPTAVITQQTHDGRVLVLDAITGVESGMGALRFIREKLKPLLTAKYSGMQVHVVIDPAAFQRAQTDERSVADVFKVEGFNLKAASTNAIAARISAGEKYMTRTIDNKPGLLIDPACTEFIQTLASKYRYKTNAKGVTDDKPEKSHPWSDYADAFTYTCLHHDGGELFGTNKMAQIRKIVPSQYVYA